jgi:hypothetical protein
MRRRPLLFLFFFLIIGLTSETSFAKQTLNHSTCQIYLPINSTVTSWGELIPFFIKKGYSPVEFQRIEILPNDALLAGYELKKEISPDESNSSSDSWGIKKTHCRSIFTIKKLMIRETWQQEYLHYSFNKNTKTRLGRKWPQPKCKLDQLIKEAPKCKVK